MIPAVLLFITYVGVTVFHWDNAATLPIVLVMVAVIAVLIVHYFRTHDGRDDKPPVT